MSKLSEAEHPYYGTHGNYYGRGGECHAKHESWADFMDEEGDSDLDMNLVYRWDWEADLDDDDKPTGEHTLSLFIVGQRKAVHRSVSIKVTAEDEPGVRAYLAPRWEKLREMWAPISTEPPAEPA